jgi:peptide/nickel transport system substrate-binding protein
MLRGSLLGGAGVGAAWMLAACGSGSGSTQGGQSAAGASTTSGTPHRGGHLRMAINTDGSADTFNPALANSPSDCVRLYVCFDPLVRVAPGFKTEPGLALEWNANADDTVYEIKLREGVTWHDGKKFTADDVIYTLRGMGSPAHYGHASVTNVRLNDLKKLNDHLVRVPLIQPNGDLQSLFINFNSSIVVQDGSKPKDFSKPIGTGPFKVQSFVPGQQTQAVANRDYWDHPKPWLDELTLISIADDQARVNAVLGGQADYCTPASLTLAKANASNSQVKLLQAQSGPSQVIYMRLDVAPFNDNRVRQALKLVADRQALIDVALSGYGNVGNDVYGHPGIADYDNSLPHRAQDIEQAQSLLKSAGQSDLRITLQTSDVAAGITDAAQLYAQQAAKAGIKVAVKTDQPSAYFDGSLLYGKMPFAQDTWPIPSLSSIYAQTFLTSGPSNETHLKDPAFTKALNKAISFKPGPERQAAWNGVQKSMADTGGSIVWASRHSVDILAPNVQGTVPGWVFAGNDQRHWEIWLSD